MRANQPNQRKVCVMRKSVMAVVLSGLLLVTGCTGDSEDGAADPAGETPSTSSPSGTPGPTPDVSFGEPFEFDDGVTVQVSAPKQFRPSAEATVGGEPDYVRVDVRLVNGTERRVSPSEVTVTVESGGGQGGDVLDPTKEMTASAPSKPVRPGGEASWTLGFGVLDPKDVTVQVQVGLDRQPVTIGRG